MNDELSSHATGAEPAHFRGIADSLAALINGLPDSAAFVVDTELRYTFAGGEALAGAGFTPSDFVGKTLSEALEPELAAQYAVHFEQALRGSSFVHEHEAHGRIYVSRGAPLRNDRGEVYAVLAFSYDITERRRSDQRDRMAATADAKFRTLFEQGSQFAGILELDGRVVEANRLCLDACGYTRGDVIGRPFWECGWWNGSASLMQMIQDGCRLAAAGDTFRREMPYFLADGTRRIVDLIIAPVKDESGAVIFLAPTGTDATERKQAEQRLMLLEAVGEATRTLVDPIAVTAESTRLLGEHLAVTRCAYADVELDNDRFTIRHDWTAPGATSTVGMYSLDLFGPRAAADMRTGRTLIVRDVDAELTPETGGGMFSAIGIKAIITYPLVKEDRLVAMMAVHQDTPRNWTAEEVGLVRDVVERSWAHIERVRAAAALVEQDRRKDEFLATLAHELRNPLAPLRNSLQVMGLAKDDPRIVEEARSIMERQLSHMVRLIDDLLDVSRINRGKIELKRERVDLAGIVQQAVETSRPLLDQAGVELVVRTPGAPVMIDGDSTRLVQVFANLLNNSAKFTDRGGRVELTLAVRAGTAEVAVRDTGIGIPPDVLPRIFTMFSQVDRTLERTQGGLGIGLSLVKGLVELHEGTVEVASEGPRKGATFTVRLPLASVADAAPQADGAPPALQHTECRVLIADDNRDSAHTLALMLRMMGGETRVAHDGVEAVKAAEDFCPDLVLLDIGMPRMNGYDACRQIRARDWKHRPTVVALTGWGSAEDKRRAEEAGFDFHLTKPVEASAVQKILAELSCT